MGGDEAMERRTKAALAEATISTNFQKRTAAIRKVRHFIEDLALSRGVNRDELVRQFSNEIAKKIVENEKSFNDDQIKAVMEQSVESFN